jgi:hypothetical protein
MFGERAALKLRLEQMKDAEERIMMQIQKERAYIFNRLRELDAEKPSETETKKRQVKLLEPVRNYLDAPNHSPEDQEAGATRTRRSRPSRRSKTTKMRETAVNILKEQTAPIRGMDLEKLIEERTGFQIANMTTFMNTIMKADDKIIKVGRGLYSYMKEEAENGLGPILLGTEEQADPLNTEQ